MGDIKEAQGLEVVATEANYLSDGAIVYYDLVRLSDATAVIDQLRAENEHLARHINKMIAERDQLRERVAELEAQAAKITGNLQKVSAMDEFERLNGGQKG